MPPHLVHKHVHQRKPTLRCRTMLVRDLRQPPPIAQYVPPKRRRRKLPLEMVLEGVCGEMSHGTVSHCRRAAAQTLTGHRHHWTLDPAAVERRRFATDNHQNGPRGNTKADAIGEHAVEVASLPHQKQKTPHTQQSKVPTTASKTVPIPHAVPIAPHASAEHTYRTSKLIYELRDVALATHRRASVQRQTPQLVRMASHLHGHSKKASGVKMGSDYAYHYGAGLAAGVGPKPLGTVGSVECTLRCTELPELPGRQMKRIAGSSIMVPRAGSSLDTDGCLPPILLDQNR